jgi:hypothetical protein
MSVDILSIAQLLVSLGGLGVAVRVAMILQKLSTSLEFAVEDIKDHEHRLRTLEQK